MNAAQIERARDVPIEDEIARRGHRHRLKRQGRELIGPCPVCGGTNRFGANVAEGIFNCRGCGVGGDVIALVMHLDSCTFAEAIETLTGFDRPPPKRVAEKPALKKKTSSDWMRLWREARPILGTLAERYLRAPKSEGGREITELPPDPDESLRFHSEVIFGKTDDGAWRYVPALLALVRDVINSKPIGLQRIGLTKDGRKLDRMALGNIGGGCVKLWLDEEVTAGLVLGEGVETTLAAATRIEHRGTLLRPAWAALFADNMAKFPVLPGIDALTLLVDHDEPDQHGRRAGQDAAAECARRWSEAGREVIRLTPTKLGYDFNDVVRQ